MNPSKANPAVSNANRYLQAVLRATWITQRSVFASALTVCTLLVSGAAIAPVRDLMSGGANVATTAAVHAGSDAAGSERSSATGGAMPAGGLAALAGKPVSMKLQLQWHPQRGFLATQMAFLGEPGSDIQFSDGDSLPKSDASTGDATTLLHESALSGRLGNHGGFGSAAHQTDPASATTAAWTGTAAEITGSSNSNTAMNVANNGAPASNIGRSTANNIVSGRSSGAGAAGDSGNVGNAQGSNCGGSPCAAPDLILALAPLTMIGTGTIRVETPPTAAGRPGGASTQQLQPATVASNPPPKSAPLVLKTLPSALEPDLRLIAAADQRSIAIPEPGSIALLGFGATVLLVFAWRRRAAVHVI